MKAIARQLELQYPKDNRGQGATVLPLSELIVKDIRPILLALLGGAGLLLVIACVNVSSLLLVRSESRRREIAVRGALGASRGRLIRQFITEGLVLMAVGSLLGLAAADGAMQVLMRLISKDMMTSMPYLSGLSLNSHVLVFACAIFFLAAALLSLPPIVRLPLNKMREGLSEGGRGYAGTLWRRFGTNLVVVELAIAVVLLVSAGLLGKSLYRLLHVEIGFQADHLATVQVALSDVTYAKDEQVYAVQKQIISRVSSLPGVQSAGISSVLPVSFNGNTDWIRFVGRPYNGEHNEVNQRDVSSAFFSTIAGEALAWSLLYRGRRCVEASGRHHQPDSGQKVFSWGRSDREENWRHRTDAEVDQGDCRRRRRREGWLAGFRDLAGRLLSVQPGCRHVLLPRRPHVADRAICAASAGRGHP